MYIMTESLYNELSYLNGIIFFPCVLAVAISLLVHTEALECSLDMKRKILDLFILRAISDAKASPENMPSSSNQ